MRTYRAGIRGLALVVLAGLAQADIAHADVTMGGTFTVSRACAAYQSIRKGTNPGDVTVEPAKTYDVLAKNKPDATHYRIVVEGAQPRERWVAAACGTVSGGDRQAAGAPASTQGAGQIAGKGGARATHVLAVSWEPAFCTKHADKSECRSLTSTSFAATHLSLHGLWPQPRGTQYCNVPADAKRLDQAHDWNGLPEPEMSPETLKRLSAVMPGVQSKLQRHEWIVHGTCFRGSADAYFARAAGLTEAVNASKVSKLFADNVGRSLSATDIRGAFDEAFGAGGGERVTVSCNGRGQNRKITELKINLAGDVTGTAGLGDLMHAAQAIPAGCPSGVVERAQH